MKYSAPFNPEKDLVTKQLVDKSDSKLLAEDDFQISRSFKKKSGIYGIYQKVRVAVIDTVTSALTTAEIRKLFP